MRLAGLLRAPPAESPDGAPLRPRSPRAMLPWKRHKFEVSRESSSSPGPPPPPPPPPAPLPRAPWGVGRLLGFGRRGPRRPRRRRGSFSVSRECPVYRALYLGHAGTLQAKGEGCTEGAVGKIWARSQAGRVGTRVRLSLAPHGLRLTGPDDDDDDDAAGAPPGEEPPASASASPPPPPRWGHLYLLPRVTHCAADARLPRLLAWVYRHEVRHKAVVLRCHAALLPKAAQARALALRLRQASDDALRDFQRLKKRSDARHQHQHLLHLHRHPPHLILGGEGERGGPSKANPAAQRSRSRGAPRLGAIAEDPLGEEREARNQDEDEEEEEDPEEEGRLSRGLRRMRLGNHAGAPRSPNPEPP